MSKIFSPGPSGAVSAPLASRFRRLAGGITLSLIVTALTLVLVELGFRSLLFSDLAFMQPLRNPALYANQFDEAEYWRLTDIFGSGDQAPLYPHQELGWIGKRFDRNNHHILEHELGDLRPVLLFGDSYADCSTSICDPISDCFDGILNFDPEFSESALLLNYGAGGYGVGQIYLNLKRTVDLYENPYVVVSFMLNDLDRTLLPFRIGQKPFFTRDQGRLHLKGYPIEASTAAYFAREPLEITSYLYRMLLHGGLLPKKWSNRLRGATDILREKIAVNRALLAAMIGVLEKRGLDYRFVVFYPPQAIQQDAGWSAGFVEGFMERRGVEWISSKALVLADMASSGRPLEEYYLPDNHPSRLQNELIAAAINSAYQRSLKR